MTANKILKKLTPERIKKELAEIQAIELPENLQKWVKEYKKVGDRVDITWKAFLKAQEVLNYFSVPVKYRDCLDEIKFLFAMFTVLIDDVADKWQNKKLLSEINKLLFSNNSLKRGGLSQRERNYLEFTLKVWSRIKYLMEKAPRYNDFYVLFEYDVKQVINAIDYDLMINHCPALINITESWLYAPHSMQFLFTTSINLMFLPTFRMEELGLIREINWLVQKMARIGNWIYTWKREVKERDFTSGVIAYAIQLNGISFKKNLGQQIEAEEMKINQYLKKEWKECYYKLYSFDQKTTVIDIPKLLIGMEILLILEDALAQYK